MVETILTALLTSGATMTLAIFLFKESITAKLKLDIEQRLNIQKAEIDKVRDAFQFQIQQAMLSFQLKTTKTHEIYPELYEKLRIAQGAASSLLGLSIKPTWEEYSEKDLEEMLQRRNIVSGQITVLLSAIQTNRQSGIKEMDKYLRMVQYNEASAYHAEAKNFITLKNLYLSDEVSELCYETCKNIWSAIVDANPEHVQYKQFKEAMAKTDELLTNIKNKMKAELSHQPINQPST